MFYFTHLLQDEEMREIIRETDMGVESIEFSISENLDDLEKCLTAYEKRLSYMECKKLTLHGPFLDLNPMAYDSLIMEVTEKRYEQAYYAAQKLGASKIVYHTCFTPQIYMLEGIADRMVSFYERFLENKDEQVEILIENVLDPVPEPLRETAERISHKKFGICLDLGHAHCYSSVPAEEWAQCLQPYIRHIHVHNNFRKKDSHLAVDRGTMDCRKVLDLIYSDKKKRTITIECSSAEEVIGSWKWLMNKKEGEERR